MRTTFTNYTTTSTIPEDYQHSQCKRRQDAISRWLIERGDAPWNTLRSGSNKSDPVIVNIQIAKTSTRDFTDTDFRKIENPEKPPEGTKSGLVSDESLKSLAYHIFEALL
jgi:hypothetical protein